MLKGIDCRLNADVLFALRSIGHGDTVVLADTNFPASQVSKSTVLGNLLRLENLKVVEAADAVMSVLPLDDFVDDFAIRMEVVGESTKIFQVQAEVQDGIDKHEGNSQKMISMERFAFYDLARQSYVVIQTVVRCFYGCFILRKGVIPPDSEEI